ncbi:hypothetical protein AB0M20_32265 [Actinoplanes sp. NPDC051633]|uniref:hypothetical protein n=1 Tax=Actinoplanes sp. NPDC051633 TaxID=3155670 RepID=UPI00344257AA
MNAPVHHEELRLVRRFLIAAAVATAGWVTTTVISTFLPPSEAGTATDPPLHAVTVFALAVGATVESVTTVRTAQRELATFGLADAAVRARLQGLRRLLLAAGRATLVAALVVVILSWTPLPAVRAMAEPLFLGLVAGGVGLLTSARGLHRGWLADPSPASVPPTPELAEQLAEKIKSQRDELRRNQAGLRHSQQDVIDLYLAIRKVERGRKERISPNALWALVGFALGIVGNWIAQPLFDLLAGPLRP